MSLTLYELTSDYKNLLDLIESGELRESDLSEAMPILESGLEIKYENYAKIIKNIESTNKGLEEEERRLNAKRKNGENIVKAMKKRMEESMILLSKEKIKTPLFSFNIQKNPPSVNILDITAIDKKYFVEQDPIISKKLILEDLHNGIEVSGATIKQDRSMRIK